MILKKSIAVLLMCSMVFMLACSTQTVLAIITTGAQVALNAANILKANNLSDLAEYLDDVNAKLNQAKQLVTDFDAALKDAKPGIAGQIQAITNTVSTDLANLFAALAVKDPGLKTEISVGVAVLNTTVTTIIAHIGAQQPQQAIATRSGGKSVTLPVLSGAKTAKDLKRAWNSAVFQSHPEAEVH